jgi:hypothetical protein
MFPFPNKRLSQRVKDFAESLYENSISSSSSSSSISSTSSTPSSIGAGKTMLCQGICLLIIPGKMSNRHLENGHFVASLLEDVEDVENM